MQPPDLASLVKKDYFILYQQQKPVPLRSKVVMSRTYLTAKASDKDGKVGQEADSAIGNAGSIIGID